MNTKRTTDKQPCDKSCLISQWRAKTSWITACFGDTTFPAAATSSPFIASADSATRSTPGMLEMHTASEWKKLFNRFVDYHWNFFRTKNENIEKLFESDKKRSIQFIPNLPAKIYLHASDEVTSFDLLPQFVYENVFIVELSVIMRETFTTKDVSQLSPAQRKCIFQTEIDLKYFNKDFYSLSSCMIQCRMEKALKLCKCIPPFYLPSKGSSRECSTQDELKCLKENRHNITRTKECSHCLLGCMNIVYESDKLTLE